MNEKHLRISPLAQPVDSATPPESNTSTFPFHSPYWSRNRTSVTEASPYEKTDAYIISTYYYPKSKSLGENAIGMVLLMNRFTQEDMRKYQIQLVASNSFNQSVIAIPTLLE